MQPLSVIILVGIKTSLSDTSTSKYCIRQLPTFSSLGLRQENKSDKDCLHNNICGIFKKYQKINKKKRATINGDWLHDKLDFSL
jgi:hypothetical protein